MNLLWQLIPYAALALLAVAGVSVYVAGASRRRQNLRRLAASAAPLPPREETLDPVARATAGPLDAVRAQILRLGEFGVNPAQIASVLSVPLEEVDLVIQLAQYQIARAERSVARKERAVAGSRLSRA